MTNSVPKPDAQIDGQRPGVTSLDRVAVLLPIALLVAILVVAGYHLILHLHVLGLTAPMGSWETVYAAEARVWPHQYQWGHYVDGHDGYGPGYPTFVRPFLALVRDGYFAHRLAGFVALVLACVLIARLLRRTGCSGIFTAGATTVFYVLNAGSYSIQARPDFLVLLEIALMFALGEKVVRGRIKAGVGFGVVFGLLTLVAFLTKGYAAFVWASVLGYLAFFVGWRGMIVTTLVSGAICAGGVGWFAALNPLYWMQIFHGPIVQKSVSLSWLLYQVEWFGGLACGLVVMGLLALVQVLRSRGKPDSTRSRPARNEAERYWQWQALILTVAVLAGPGWHTGAYLTYFFHLMLVPLVMVAGFQVKKTAIAGMWGNLVLMANLVVLMIFSPSWPRPDSEWQALRQDILQEPGHVAVDYLMEPLVRAKPGITLLSTGLTGYALQEPFLIDAGPNPAVMNQARAEVTEFVRKKKAQLFGEHPVDSFYLDCLIYPALTGQKGPRFSVISREQLPYLTGPEMGNYVPSRVFQIYPYYFATNAPRQTAGELGTVIVKMVRKK